MMTFDVALSTETFTSNFLISRTTKLVAFAIAIAFSIVLPFLVSPIVSVATDTTDCSDSEELSFGLMPIQNK
jgi:hypothetical protein